MKTQRRVLSLTRASATKAYRPSTPSRLQHPEMLSLGFQIFEDLTTLRRHCVEEVESARKSADRYRTFLVRPDQSGLRRWRQMLDQVTGCWCVLDDLVRTHRLDATRSHEVYLDLLGIQVAWQHIDGPAHLGALIARTIDHVRQLRIRHAQRPHHQG